MKTMQTLIRKTREINKRNELCSQIGGRNIKMSVLPNLIWSFNTTSIKILTGLFVDIDKLILNLYKNA